MSKWYFQFCGTGNPMVFDRKWKDPVADSFRSQVCRFPTDGQQPQGEIFPRGRWSESISINDPMFLFLISRTSHYCWRTKPKPFLTSTGCWHAPSCLLWTAAALLNLSGEPLNNVVDSGIFKHDHQIWVQGSCLHWSPSTKINPAFNLNSVQKPCWVTIRSGFKNPVDWCWLMIRSGIILAFIHGGLYNTILYYDMGANYITQWYIVIYYDCDGNPFLRHFQASKTHLWPCEGLLWVTDLLTSTFKLCQDSHPAIVRLCLA